MSENKIKPGWYEDTTNPKNLRWWDGDQFTNNVRANPSYESASVVAEDVDSGVAAVDAVISEESASLEEGVKKDMSSELFDNPPADEPVVSAPAAEPLPAYQTAPYPQVAGNGAYYQHPTQQMPPQQYIGNGQPPYRPETMTPKYGGTPAPYMLKQNILALVLSGIVILGFPIVFIFMMMLYALMGPASLVIVSLGCFGVFVNQLVQGIRGISKPFVLLPDSSRWKVLSILNIAVGSLCVLVSGILALSLLVMV